MDKRIKPVRSLDVDLLRKLVNVKENAKRNNIGNAKFYIGKAEQIVPKLYQQNIKADIVIVDDEKITVTFKSGLTADVDM